MKRYLNRNQAGQVLAKEIQKKLPDLKDNPHALVLALPRGGVPVAKELAEHLNLPLDVIIVRKIGHPFNKEYAIGAIGPFDIILLDEAIDERFIEDEKKELQRRETLYRQNKPYPNFKNKTIVLVDDGIATGLTLKAALMSLKKCQAQNIIVAVPVCSKNAFDAIAPLVNQVICPYITHDFEAVGCYYEDFTQINDEEVIQTLHLQRFNRGAKK